MSRLTQYQIIHELLTPLNSLISMIELLKNNRLVKEFNYEDHVQEFVKISSYSA